MNAHDTQTVQGLVILNFSVLVSLLNAMVAVRPLAGAIMKASGPCILAYFYLTYNV